MPLKRIKSGLKRCHTVCEARSASPSKTFSRLSSSKPSKTTARYSRHISDIDEESFMSRRRQRFKSLGPPKCAQQFYPSPLTHRSNYNSYGATSDKTTCQLDASFSRPDPYRTLQLEVLTILKKRNLAQQATTSSAYKLDLADEYDFFHSCSEGSRTVPDSPATGKGEYQYDTEDDEEEEGAPQAVRANLPRQDPNTSVEISRVLHLQKMEKIARTISPASILSHLDTLGYMRHQYHQHSRSSLDQQNLKSGLKKGVERLYLALPSYSM